MGAAAIEFAVRKLRHTALVALTGRPAAQRRAQPDPGGVTRRDHSGHYINGSEAASATATRTAATAATALTGLGFVDLEGAAPEVLTIQRLHGARGIRARHFDESKPARAARITVGDERQRLDRPVRSKQRAHSVLGRGEG
jgi:hypothetical protein